MQYSNIATVTLNQAATIVESLIPLNLRPQFLWGAYGVGKSSIVRSIVASLSEQTGKPWGFIDARASQLDAVDTRGVPDLVDGRTVFALPDWLPRVERDGEQGILFLDEIILKVEVALLHRVFLPGLLDIHLMLHLAYLRVE